MKSILEVSVVVAGLAGLMAITMLAVFIARRWPRLPFDTTLVELRNAMITALCQFVLGQFFSGGWIVGIFVIVMLPTGVIFWLAHRDRWNFFESLKFAALQAALFCTISRLLSPPVY